MKNYVQKGESIDVIGPSGGVLSGEAFMIGDLALVASVDIAEGEKGAARTVGVFSLPVKGVDASANAAIGIGQTIYLSSGELNSDSTNGKVFGKALGEVESGSVTIIPVRLSN